MSAEQSLMIFLNTNWAAANNEIFNDHYLFSQAAAYHYSPDSGVRVMTLQSFILNFANDTRHPLMDSRYPAGDFIQISLQGMSHN